MSRDDFNRGFNSAGGDLNSPEARRGHAEWQRQEKERSERNTYKPTPEPALRDAKPDFSRRERTFEAANVRQHVGQASSFREHREKLPRQQVCIWAVLGALCAATYAWLGLNGSLSLVAVYAVGGAIAGRVLLFLAIIVWKLVIIAVKIIAVGAALAFVGAVLWMGLQDNNQVKEQFTILKPASPAQERFTGLKTAPPAKPKTSQIDFGAPLAKPKTDQIDFGAPPPQPKRNQITYDELLAIPKNGSNDFGKGSWSDALNLMAGKDGSRCFLLFG